MAAFVRRRPGVRRWSRGPRRKRQGTWTGLNVWKYTLTANATSSWFLWDDLHSQKYSMPGHGVHQRTLVWMLPFHGSSSQPEIAWTVGHYQTDQNGVVPSSLVVNPLGWNGTAYVEGEALFERDLMHFDVSRFVVPSASTTAFAWDYVLKADIRSKRRVQDTDAILLSIASTYAIQVTFYARTYMSW